MRLVVLPFISNLATAGFKRFDGGCIDISGGSFFGAVSEVGSLNVHKKSVNKLMLDL